MTSNSPSENQIHIMLDLQYKLNSIVDQDWLIKKFPYLRAAFVESAEALDHLGWKWWKQQDTNIPQVQIEISDILHFYLSDILVSCTGNIKVATITMQQECQSHAKSINIGESTFIIDDSDTQTLFELLAATSVLRTRSFPVFQKIMHRCGLDWSSLFEGYVSKNVLNIFRQNNGYKEGTYLKFWNNKEDNEHLHEIMLTLDPSAPSFSSDIYFCLTEKYKTINN